MIRENDLLLLNTHDTEVNSSHTSSNNEQAHRPHKLCMKNQHKSIKTNLK